MSSLSSSFLRERRAAAAPAAYARFARGAVSVAASTGAWHVLSAYFWKNSSVESGVVGFVALVGFGAVAGPASVAGGGVTDSDSTRSNASCLRSRLREQFHQRIGRDGRIQVEHEPILVAADRRQRKHLRLHRTFQVEHHAHDMRLILPDAHRLNLRIVRRDLRDEIAQRLIEIDAG